MGTVTNLLEYKQRKEEEKQQNDINYLRKLLTQHYFFDVEDLPPMLYDTAYDDNMDLSIQIMIEESKNDTDHLQDPDR